MHFGISIVEARKPLTAENRDSCVVTIKFRRRGGRAGGGLGVTVAITTILFHRLSFIKLDKLLKELLSDCCWYVARKQPSVSVSEAIALLSCVRGGEQRAVLWEAAVDGSLDFLHVQPEGQQCCVSQAFSTIIAIRSETDELLQLHKSCCSSLGSSLSLSL